MLMVYQGTTGSDRWLSEAERKATYAAYAEVNETKGVAPGLPLGQPHAARTVQVRDGVGGAACERQGLSTIATSGSALCGDGNRCWEAVIRTRSDLFSKLVMARDF